MIIRSANVWYDEKFQPLQLVIEDNKIKQIVPDGFYQQDVYDVGEAWVLPGLIDIHCHGYGGVNANFATLEGLKKWNDALPAEGVTAYMITSSTAPWEDLLKSYQVINEFIESQPTMAEPLGIHIEGPFISKEFKGAHNPTYIVKPTVKALKELQAQAPNKVKMVAVAIEEDEGGAFTRYCTENDITVILGHTAASYADVEFGRTLGARSFTHTFNAMVPLHHRNPGVIGAAMRFEDMYAEVIADGVHVNIDLVNVLGRLKGKDKLIVITDAVAHKGLPVGKHQLRDRIVEVGVDGVGRLENGTIAGSSNKMNDMVKNLLYRADLPLATAINAATKNPAHLLKLHDKGELEVGFAADFIVTTPDLTILETYKAGKLVYQNKK